jgi:hypothetical protein
MGLISGEAEGCAPEQGAGEVYDSTAMIASATD